MRRGISWRTWGRTVVLLGGFAVIASTSGGAFATEPLRDVPVVWWEDDRAISVAEPPRERDPAIGKDQVTSTVIRPIRRNTRFSRVVRRVGSLFGGDHVPAATNVNSLDEVPNSTWFTNRIGLVGFSLEETARGVGRGTGPDTTQAWTVVSAKTQGVTPGFNVKDARGDTYLIKFDPPGSLGLTSIPGAICARVLHAAGYNVPEDAMVKFRRDQLVVGEGVKIKTGSGKRPMTDADLDEILARGDTIAPGRYLAISSKFLSGKPLGPFDYQGRREDDPNDHVRHEHRRELRGLRLFAAWLHHFDSKQHNSLDMLVEEDGVTFVRHYLIDFASTLGAGANGPKPKYGREYGLDLPQILARTLAVGFHEDDWRRVEAELPPPDLGTKVGYFDVDRFDPKGFKPLLPNPAFASLTDRDGYWAAKIIAAFTDAHLEAIGEGIRSPDPAVTNYLIQQLKGRRDIIAREWFTRVAPLDEFQVTSGATGRQLQACDLGVRRKVWGTKERKWSVRAAAVNADREAGAWSSWAPVEVDDEGRMAIPLNAAFVEGAAAEHSTAARPFLAFEFRVATGGEESPPVRVFLARESGRIVEIKRSSGG